MNQAKLELDTLLWTPIIHLVELKLVQGEVDRKVGGIVLTQYCTAEFSKPVHLTNQNEHSSESDTNI